MQEGDEQENHTNFHFFCGFLKFLFLSKLTYQARQGNLRLGCYLRTPRLLHALLEKVIDFPVLS